MATALPVLGFDLDDTLWDTTATLRGAHEAMVKAAPTLSTEHRTPAGFKDEMLSTRDAHPDNAHDFTFVRKETLRRILGSDELAEAAFGSWFAARNTPLFYPGAVETLRTLQGQGYRLCAISDGNSQPMDPGRAQPCSNAREEYACRTKIAAQAHAKH